jgi:hypothetical protein
MSLLISRVNSFLFIIYLVCDRVAAYTKDRLAKLVSLIGKETPVNEEAVDSDDDNYHHEF